MIPEPKPRFARVLLPGNVRIKFCTLVDGEVVLMDGILNPMGAGWVTLAYKTDENGNPMGPWEERDWLQVLEP